jgi:Ser/Thr protein kinase RdoA (MazF antagonist)
MRAALRAWGDVTVVGPLAGGHRNQVREVRRGGERLVARQSGRGPASLDWEADLLGHLARHGFRVPSVIPALDGRRQVDGVMVQSWLAGERPGPADWPAVAATLRRLREVTAGWPQRPGLASTRDLLHVDRGGDVDLTAMPPAVAVACRRAWARLDGVPEAVVHGDPGPSNIRVTSDGVGLLDWDEARVDRVDLDLADLPFGALPASRLLAARDAVTAWEVAACWVVEPAYARRRLRMLGSSQQE